MMRLIQICGSLALALMFLSCNSEQREKLSNLFDKESGGNIKTIRSTEGCCEIRVPGSWKEDKELNDQANIQASNRMKELYVIVLSESKENFENMNLENHSKLTRSEFLKSLSSPQTIGPVSVTVNNNPGVQYEIFGGTNNVKIAALHTTVETEKHFHQILAWTIKSRADKNKPILQNVIQSFKESGSSERRSIPAPKPN